MDKREFYQQDKVVDDYEAWRFGSPGGRYVDETEKRTLIALLEGAAKAGPLLDLPCGTGRLLTALAAEGFTDLTGADTSPAMLAKAGAAAPGAKVTEGDAFASPFPDGAFETVCSLRFLFHVETPGVFFKEVHRVLRPGGLFVFDTLRWTPRGLVPAVDRALGGRLFCHGEDEVAGLLAEHGFSVLGTRRVFAMPSLAYNYLPGFMVPAVAWLERHLPAAGFSKAFVVARRA